MPMLKKPNTTLIPNIVIDFWVKSLNGVQLKILLFFLYKRLEFENHEIQIPKTKISQALGISTTSCITGILSLKKLELISVKNLINPKSGCATNVYKINDENLFKTNEK